MGEDKLEADKAIEYDKNCLQKSSERFTEMFDQCRACALPREVVV